MGGPCRDCADRGFACHCTCAKYRQWSKIHQEALEKDYDARIASRYEHERGMRIKGWKIKSRARGRKR